MSGSLFRPLKALGTLFEAPITLPMAPRPAAERYRGFHLNDHNKCIGCGTCSRICDNAAIRMVHDPELRADPVKGIRAERPAIDYGRCCWCALCVDACPTGSLSLSREYIHISENLDTFFFVPDEQGMHGFGFEHGWDKGDDNDLLAHQRQPMAEVGTEERLGDMREIVLGFDPQAALVEASRCIQCGLCHDACPTHMHAPEYIRAVWEGDFDEAVRQIYRTMPFGSVCGRVCTHRCESACSLHHRGDPIAIRWLKRYALDQLSPERVGQIASEGRTREKSGRRIAIIGSGPAGLTTAYDLAREGHTVVVYEAQTEPGGMMRYGIPEYRLPRDKLDQDIDIIRAQGVEIRTGIRVGEQVTLEGLATEYDAVVVAIGLHQGRSTRIPGSDHPAVMRAVDLLRTVWSGADFEVPRSATVIGGGNVAMDAARTLARLQRRCFGEVQVHLCALEAEEGMLADREEIHEAREEGIRINPSRGPRRCMVEEGQLTGLETVACLSIFDDTGRFHPRYDEEDARTHPAELIVEAVGQMADIALLPKSIVEQLEWERGRLKVDNDGATALPWLWAAGDMVEGPDVVHAVAAGHRVASSIHRSLQNNRGLTT